LAIGIVEPGAERGHQVPWIRHLQPTICSGPNDLTMLAVGFAEDNIWGFKGAEIEDRNGLLTVPVLFADESQEVTIASISFETNITKLRQELKESKGNAWAEKSLELARAYCKRGLIFQARAILAELRQARSKNREIYR